MSFWLFVLLGGGCCFLLSLEGGWVFEGFGGLFLLDDVGLFLSLISFLFVLSLFLAGRKDLGDFEFSYLGVSLLFSMVCFNSGKSLLFWLSYELAIIPLLVGLYSTSPYSERYLAGWYLLSYILVTSLPMLVLMFYFSVYFGSFDILGEKGCGCLGEVLLFILFMTKVPLPPFHAWLPVVHAEASTFSSMCLSGYVMKLGLMGVLRFCLGVLGDMVILIVLLFFFSLFFFMSSCSELDTKRWLAFLSLSHILVPLVGLYFLGGGELLVCMAYCFGHGVSAAMLFYLFFCLYIVSGTRNWLLLYLGDSGSVVWRALVILGLLSVSSFPPSVSFMSEIFILSSSVGSGLLLVIFCLYLFFGGLVPMVVLSGFVCNGSSLGFGGGYYISRGVLIICFFLVWFVGGVMV